MVETVSRQEPVAQLPPLLDPAVTRSAIVGEDVTHTTTPGDTLPKLAAWYGVDAKVLASENQLRPGAALKPGQALHVPNRHIVPSGTYDGILINIPQRHLFHFQGGALGGHYPIAVGRGDWRTPTGGFHVAVKETNPTWEVPRSIQQEMIQQGKAPITSIPPGPENPLGKYWIGLNRTGVGIHGTNSPESIYHSGTHGCIRMHADGIEKLFNSVAVNTPVTVIYQPVLFGVASDGVYLEAHPDVYRKGGNAVAVVEKLAVEAGVADRIDWEAVRQVLAKREGVARPIARATGL
jgi:L,D-transpeptidase ErfK/SrfK